MIRAIIFDCFGVLYSGSLTYLKSMTSDMEARKMINDINKQKDYGLISNEEYIAQIAEIIGKTNEVRDIVNNHVHRHIIMTDFCKKLHKEGHKIGLLSNMGEDTYDRLFPDGDEMFDEILLSYNESIAKPNPEIYKIMADRMSIAPEECVMIDDSASNCEGAEVAGMYSIQHVTYESTLVQLNKLMKG